MASSPAQRFVITLALVSMIIDSQRNVGYKWSRHEKRGPGGLRSLGVRSPGVRRELAMRFDARLFTLVHGMLRLQSPTRRRTMRPQSRSQRLWKVSTIACAAMLAVQVLAGAAMAQPAPEPTLAPIIGEGGPNTIPASTSLSSAAWKTSRI